MTLIIIFIVVATLAYFALRTILKGPKLQGANYKTLNDASDATESISSELEPNFDLVRQPDGSYKNRSDIEEEEEGWAEWRDSLVDSGVQGVQGERISFKHSGGDSVVKFAVAGVLTGSGRIYLDGLSDDNEERRTYRFDRISNVTTNDGVEFQSGYEWLTHRSSMPPALADEWGLQMPNTESRR